MPLLAILLATAIIQSPATNFKIEELAKGVYAVIRQDKPGLMVDANNLFIVNDTDVIVVDSNGSPYITREVVKALRRITKNPVSMVVNTHYHDDHIRGNSVYRDAFPNVEFVAGEFAKTYLPGDGAKNRASFLKEAPGFLSYLRRQRLEKKSLLGGVASEEEMKMYDSDISLADLVLKDGEKAETILPTRTVQNELSIKRGNREIRIMHLGNGHTAADLVVFLPNEKIVATGDLVVWPVPLVGNPQSYITNWGPTLRKLVALGATTYVPGHGTVLRDDAYLANIAEMFEFISAKAREAVANHQTLATFRSKLDLKRFEKKLAGDSAVRQLLFTFYVQQPAIPAAFNEAGGKG